MTRTGRSVAWQVFLKLEDFASSNELSRLAITCHYKNRSSLTATPCNSISRRQPVTSPKVDRPGNPQCYPARMPLPCVRTLPRDCAWLLILIRPPGSLPAAVAPRRTLRAVGVRRHSARNDRPNARTSEGLVHLRRSVLQADSNIPRSDSREIGRMPANDSTTGARGRKEGPLRPDALYTRDQLTRALGLGKNTVTEWVAHGLPALIPFEERLFFEGDEVIKWIRKRSAGK